MLNGKQISGTGGALDFVRGARLTKNVRSIIALPVTTAKGTRSRIILRLDKKAVVSVPRTDLDYVVTEYGAVRLAHRLKKIFVNINDNHYYLGSNKAPAQISNSPFYKLIW
jgi:acyl-CoA hydrolase